MSTDEQAVLDGVNADHWTTLCRCRWSKLDTDRVVPQLMELLVSGNPPIIHEARRALLRIGTPVVAAAVRVSDLARSHNWMTKRLAVLALGQIAYEIPGVSVASLVSTSSDPMCRKDALRALAFIANEPPSAHGVADGVL